MATNTKKGVGINWTTGVDFSSVGGPAANARGGVRWAVSRGYNPYTGERMGPGGFTAALAAQRAKKAKAAADAAALKEDPYGLQKYITAYNAKQDANSVAHQAWSKDVRTGLEASLGRLYDVGEGINNRYATRIRELQQAPQSNAPEVASSSGSGAVADPNAQATVAQSQAAQDMGRANAALAELAAKSDNLTQKDWITGQLKNYDYASSRIPALYNEAKTKYESALVNAALEIEGKKDVAQIGADATTYASQNNLLAALAGVQSGDQKAMLQALTGMYNTDQTNQNRIAVAGMNNATRVQVANINGAASLKRAAAQSQLRGQKLNNDMWLKFWNGMPAKDAGGVDAFYDVDGKTLLPGATPPASQILKSNGNEQKKIQMVQSWLDLATSNLNMSPQEAAAWVQNKIVGNKAQRNRIMAAAIRSLR